jgi:hypothetical protein
LKEIKPEKTREGGKEKKQKAYFFRLKESLQSRRRKTSGTFPSND